MWGRWALFFWNVLSQINGGGLQHRLRLRGGKVRLCAALDRNPTFEHCQIMVCILPWKSQTGSTGRFKWSQSAGFSAVIGQFHTFREDHKTLKSGFGNQIASALKISVNCCLNNARTFGRLR